MILCRERIQVLSISRACHNHFYPKRGYLKEKKKLITLPLPVEDCFTQLTQLVPNLGWLPVSQNPDTYPLHWRKGDSWWIKRRHDLRISLVKRATRATELIITVKDPWIIWGGGELIAQDLAQVVEHIQTDVKLLAQ